MCVCVCPDENRDAMEIGFFIVRQKARLSQRRDDVKRFYIYGPN